MDIGGTLIAQLVLKLGTRWRSVITFTPSRFILGLHQQSPRHFAWQPSGWITHTLRPSYLQLLLNQTITDTLSTLNTFYAHMSSRTLLIGDINLGSLTLPVSEGGDVVEILLLYFRWKNPRYPLNRRLHVSQKRSWCFQEAPNVLPCQESNPRLSNPWPSR